MIKKDVALILENKVVEIIYASGYDKDDLIQRALQYATDKLGASADYKLAILDEPQSWNTFDKPLREFFKAKGATYVLY